MRRSFVTRASLVGHEGIDDTVVAEVRRLLDRAYGPAAPEESEAVACRLGACRGQTIRFATEAYDRLVIELGDTLPDVRDDHAAAEAFVWTAPDRARHLVDRWLAARPAPPRRRVAVCMALWQRPPAEAARPLALLARRMAYRGDLVLAVPAETRAAWQDLGPATVAPADLADDPDVVAVVALSSGATAAPHRGLRPLFGRVPFFWSIAQDLIAMVARDGRLAAHIDPEVNPQLRHNFLVRNLPADRLLAQLPSPAGLIKVLLNGHGPIDPFGHRIGGRIIELGGRAPDHLVVALFGGSCAFGQGAFQDHTPAGWLQAWLNDHLPASGLPWSRATVLNFGLPGTTLGEALTRLVTFAHGVRPDVVLAHIGANESGADTNDPALLADYGLMYETQAWDPRRYDTPVQADPDLVARVFRDRVTQLADLARAGGAAFVLGLQPHSAFKSWTEAEREAIESFQARAAYVREHVQRGYAGYARFVATIAPWATHWAESRPATVFADQSGLFRDQPTRTVFVDHVHLTPEGNRCVAEHYGRLLVDQVLPSHRAVTAAPPPAPPDRPDPARDLALAIAQADAEPALADLAQTLRDQRSAILAAARDQGRPAPGAAAGPARRVTYPLD